jgi:Uma2 family endonuclease
MTYIVDVVITTAPPDARDSNDPFRYGWRPVTTVAADGREQVELVPLTLTDVLHPEVGDQVTHAEPHERRCVYLYNVLTAQLAADPSAVVLHDVRVAWDVPGLRPHGPDLAVVLNVRARQAWTTFDVAVEGVRPDIIIEVTSPETAALDRSTKMEQYELARVPLYVIVDAVSLRRAPSLRLLGYQLTPTGYQPLAPDDHGRLWLGPARLWLAVEDDEIVCYDAEERRLDDYTTLARTLNAAEVAREAASQRADRAEARLREMEAEMRRLRRDVTSPDA